MGFFSKLFSGLKKTKDAIASKINAIFVGELDDDFYEELEEIFEEFSPTSAVGYLEYNDKLERCSDTYNDIYRKVEECNKYMEHYNDVMGHFPYDCIEFSKLEEIQF